MVNGESLAQITPDFYMQMALDYAWGFQCLALPNPTVAALVLDKNGAIIALEAHTKCGESHAELKALAAAFAKLTGDSTPLTLQNPFEMFDFLAENHRGVFNETTIFSTLEPCNHRGKTPSCAEILALVRPKKIYISVRDSHECAKGGIERLKNADIALSCGVLEERGRDLLLPFLCLQERGRFTLYKLATRLNGDVRGGVISCEKSRSFSHKLRSVAKQMVVSQRTILEDDPLLDSRLVGGRAPDLLILGRKNQLHKNLRIFNDTYRRGLLRCSFRLLRAVRRPQTAGRVTGTDSRAFSFIVFTYLINEPSGSGICGYKMSL